MSHFDAIRDIYDLTSDHLPEIFFKENKQTPLAYIKNKSHVTFLEEYLGPSGLNARFIVAEREYIHKDYLTDYSFYYSSCFPVYLKTCVRLHFFSSIETIELFREKFSASVIEGIKDTAHEEFWKHNYLGYIVVKPTPNHFIGFTLLKHYEGDVSINNSPQRNFWGTKQYTIHLFGNAITITSLAFQEQDRNVAACATIAVWSMLQRAAEDYYVVLQSPSEITEGIGSVGSDGSRLIPNKGLSMLQMAQAITRNNLATLVRGNREIANESINTYFKKLIRAYAPLRIPIILGILLPPSKGEKEYARHAVAICGHQNSLATETERKNCFLKKDFWETPRKIKWRSDNIIKIYTHDDQWGPFSRMIFRDDNLLDSSWQLITEKKIPCEVVSILISVFPKVRIPFEEIEARIIALHKIFVDHFADEIKGDFIWDIQLFLSEEFKNQIQQSAEFDDVDEYDKRIQYKFLTRSLPKYIWVATLHVNENKVFHFVYDATGLSGSNILLSIIGYYPFFSNIFINILRANQEADDPDFTYIFDYDIKTYIRVAEQMLAT